MIGLERDLARSAALERRWFVFQPQRPLQVNVFVRWWYWIPLVVVVGGAVAAVVLGHTSSPYRSFFGTQVPAGAPAGEIQVVDRSLGNGWSIRVFDNARAGPLSDPQIAYAVLQDGEGVASRGPLPLDATPHLTVPGLALVRGDPDGDEAGWRWTTYYEVTDPSITVVRAVFAGQVVDAMRPVKLDDIRFVVLTTDEDAARVHVEGLSGTGHVLALAPIADPTFGKAIP